jgi:hypothetical protein
MSKTMADTKGHPRAHLFKQWVPELRNFRAHWGAVLTRMEKHIHKFECKKEHPGLTPNEKKEFKELCASYLHLMRLEGASEWGPRSNWHTQFTDYQKEYFAYSGYYGPFEWDEKGRPVK